jgi:predicted PurR-regulated permease PerM
VIPAVEHEARSGPAPPAKAAPITRAASAASWSVTGLFVLLLLYSLHIAAEIVLPIVVALLLAMLLSPPLRVLNRIGIPVPLAAAIVVLLSS